MPAAAKLVDAKPDAQMRLRLLLEKAKQRGVVFAETILVDRELAQAIMALNNPKNRRFRQGTFRKYARQVDDGQWLQTGETVKINRDGQMDDGQHRVAAIIETGKTLPLLICFNTDPEAFAVMDTGMRRTASDAFNHAGFRNATSLAAAARTLWLIEYTGGVGRDAVSHRDLIAYVESHHPDLVNCIPASKRLIKELKVSGAGATAAYYLIRYGSEHADKLEAFWDQLVTGADLSRNSPILRLRRKIQTSLTGDFEERERACGVAALLILCWNAWVTDDERISAMTWNRVTFPSVR